jgi:membrane-bound serine protease (ClpP class)
MAVVTCRRLAASTLAAALVVLALSAAPARAQPSGPEAVSIELTGTIDPATSAWVSAALEDAAQRNARVVIVRLDTPGGLDASMREIVQELLAAPMPVIVYVSPEGARAASAGLFITLAGDVAAMAPRTNIGAATPVMLGGEQEENDVLGRKVRNDAAAYVRALAEGRGRNADLAERMVRDAVSVSAERALEEGLIEVVAAGERELLERIDGRSLPAPREGERLDTAGVAVERRDMPLRYEIQQLLVNPTMAYLLLLGGILLIGLEIFSPGLIGPGLFGAVAVILGLYGTAQLPVNAAGVLLLLLGLGLIAAELLAPGVGVLGAAGAAALAGGGLLMFETDSEALSLSVPIAIGVGVGFAALSLFAASKALAVRTAPVRGGPTDLVGATGTVRVPLDPVGQVYVDGALWRARAASPIPVGTKVEVEDVDGLTLTVRSPRQGDNR